MTAVREHWHGKRTGYTHHRCRCTDCTRAQREYMAEFSRRPRDPAALRHGELATYTNYGCRCPACRAANTEESRRYRARRASP